MKLYGMELSGNCYKVRLLCALLGLKYESIPVDLRSGEHKRPEFLKLNPRGQVPVLDDCGTVIWDSMAILVYLATRFGGKRWAPQSPEAWAEIMQWLAVSENELLYGLARARGVRKFNRTWDIAACQELGRQGLALLESRLVQREWLAGDGPTLADIACYPYVALAPEGDVPLDDFPEINTWMRRIQALPAYVSMPGIGSP